MTYVYILKGRSRSKASDVSFEEALTLAEEALAQSFGLDNAYLNLGIVQYVVSDKASALKNYLEAIRIKTMIRGYLKGVLASSLRLDEDFLWRL